MSMDLKVDQNNMIRLLANRIAELEMENAALKSVLPNEEQVTEDEEG